MSNLCCDLPPIAIGPIRPDACHKLRLAKIAKRVCIIALTAWLGLLTNAAQAQFLPDDATVDFFSGGDLIAGYANSHDQLLQINRTSPTINIVNGAGIRDSAGAFNSSIIIMTGGNAGSLGATDTATVNLSGGSVGVLSAVTVATSASFVE